MNIDFNKGMPRLSAALDSTEDGTVTIEHLCERIAAAQGDLSEAEGKGLFAPLPKNEPERSKDPSRIKTIRNRFFILGYLENDTTVVAFEISVDANTGSVTLTQSRAVVHDDATDPVEAEDGTVRKQFAENKQNNIIHASDSIENAAIESTFFFSKKEIIDNQTF